MLLLLLAFEQETAAVKMAVQRFRLVEEEEVYATILKHYPGNKSRATWATEKVRVASCVCCVCPDLHHHTYPLALRLRRSWAPTALFPGANCRAL